MNSKSWLTKADVLEDLTKATGRRVSNVDSHYFVVGETPPPQFPINHHADDEMELLFGSSMNPQNISYNVIKPDLKGITKLIRMVQEYDKISDDESEIACTARTKSPCNIISISKLNPNVKEFVPNDSSKSLSVQEKDEIVDIISSNIVNNNSINVSSDVTDNENEVHKSNSNIVDETDGKEVVNVNTTTNRLDMTNLKPNEINDIATELKNKIIRSDTSKGNTFDMKRQRNVAIANLQKLFSKPLVENHSSADKSLEKPLKLITPEYYKTCKALDVPKEHINEEKGEIIITNPVYLKLNRKDLTAAKCNSNPISPVPHENSERCIAKTISLDAELQNENITIIKKDQNSTAKSSSDPQIRNSTINAEKYVKKTISDPQIQDSINKVNKWLYKTDTYHKVPPVCLNPVVFKRKETNNGNLPKVKKIAKPSYGVTEEYKPSEYADELMKTYMERALNSEKEKRKLTWANLDVVLKEKDEQIRAEASKRSVECSASECGVSDSVTKVD